MFFKNAKEIFQKHIFQTSKLLSDCVGGSRSEIEMCHLQGAQPTYGDDEGIAGMEVEAAAPDFL